MSNVFLTVFNVAVTAGWLCLAVVLLRLLFKKAPKALTCLLWAVVGLRLIFPFSLESVFSLIPSAQTLPPEIIYTDTPVIDSGIPPINDVVNPSLSQTMAPVPGESVNPMQVIVSVAALVWVIGVALMLAYMAFTYLRIRLRVREAVCDGEGVWICDRVDSPFILGVVRPRIYLPSELKAEDRTFVLAHERAHLRRRDHWWKPLGFLLLSIYWFHPLLWLAYVLLCRDIEFACDEKVLAEMGDEAKHDYSMALVHCSIPKRQISACPVAFGETGVVSRVKRVMYYKKPGFWIILATVVALTVTAVCFLTNPPGKEEDVPPSIDADNAVALLYRDVDDYYYSAPEKLQDIAACINGMELTPAKAEDAEGSTDTPVYLFATYGDGTQKTLVLRGEYVQFLGGKWFRMQAEDRERLQALLWETPTDPAPATGTVFDYIGGTLPQDCVEWTVAQFPDVTFRCDYRKLEAVTEDSTVTLFEGNSIRNVVLADLNFDGNPELCGTVPVGVANVTFRVEVYDYANGQRYTMEKAHLYNFYVKMVDGRPMVLKQEWASNADILSFGVLTLSPAEIEEPLYMSEVTVIADMPTKVSCNIAWDRDEEELVISGSTLTVLADGVPKIKKSCKVSGYYSFFVPGGPAGYSLCFVNRTTKSIRYVSFGMVGEELTFWKNGTVTPQENSQKQIDDGYWSLSKSAERDISGALGAGERAFVMYSYEGSYVLCVEKGASSAPRESNLQQVGLTLFRHETLNTEIMVCREGSLVSMAEALERGWITQRIVWKARNIHVHFFPGGYHDYELKVRTAFLKKEGKDDSSSPGDLYYMPYIYESERFSVTFIVYNSLWSPRERIVTIEGIEFQLWTNYKLYVYSNKKMYTLQEAYDAGILSVEDLQTVHYAYENIADAMREWGKEVYGY